MEFEFVVHVQTAKPFPLEIDVKGSKENFASVVEHVNSLLNEKA